MRPGDAGAWFCFRLARNLPRRDTTRKDSVATSRFRAALDRDYPTALLAAVSTRAPPPGP